MRLRALPLATLLFAVPALSADLGVRSIELHIVNNTSADLTLKDPAAIDCNWIQGLKRAAR